MLAARHPAPKSCGDSNGDQDIEARDALRDGAVYQGRDSQVRLDVQSAAEDDGVGKAETASPGATSAAAIAGKISPRFTAARSRSTQPGPRPIILLAF
jgi:hypothetical protein